MRRFSFRGRLPRVWPAVFVAQCAGTLVLWALLALGAGIDIAPSNLPGNAVFAPWPVTGTGSAIAAGGWGLVVAVTIALLLRPMLEDQPQRPSLGALTAAVAVGGYVPFALADGFRYADPQSGVTLPAIVLTSVLVRLTTWRAEASPSGPPARPDRWRTVAMLAVGLCVVVPWAALHPIQVEDLTITDLDGSSTTSPSSASRTLSPGAGQRIDVEIDTVAGVRVLDVRPVVPEVLRAVPVRMRRQAEALPRELRAGEWVRPRFRVSFRRCDTPPVRVDAVRVRFVRLGRTISQTLPLPTPLTLRCERAAR